MELGKSVYKRIHLPVIYDVNSFWAFDSGDLPKVVLLPGSFQDYGSGVVSYTDASGTHTYSFIVSQRHLNLPVLYKYYSDVINFSVGPTQDFFFEWKQKDKDSPVRIENFDVDPKVKVLNIKAGLSSYAQHFNIRTYNTSR